MGMHIITLAGVPYEVDAPAFGVLRKIISSINKMRNTAEAEDSMAQSAIIFGLLIGKTPEEIDAMRITLQEVEKAMAQVPAICGIVEEVTESGEAQQVTAGILSTAT